MGILHRKQAMTCDKCALYCFKLKVLFVRFLNNCLKKSTIQILLTEYIECCVIRFRLIARFGGHFVKEIVRKLQKGRSKGILDIL